MSVRAVPTISAEDARKLLLGAQGLLDDPEKRATLTFVEKLIARMGFVQIDSINVVERAHHLILASRLDGYRPPMLHKLLEKKRSLFEHWTHDASAIPCEWFPHWRHRFARYEQRAKRSKWWRERLGKSPERVVRHVLARIERDGPLLSRDFEDARKNGEPKGWWGWKPQKIALEHLWRKGELAIAGRVNFQKLYDLTHRVLPDAHALEHSAAEEHIEWACATALQRLGIATPTELAAFWDAVDAGSCRTWCAKAERDGRIVRVLVEAADGSQPREAFAVRDWERRLSKLPGPPSRMRLLCPFDPVLRDRKRALRLFGFDYRFEAFVPEPKRVYGYYVMPILEGDRMVGRVNPKFDRAAGVLEIRNVWWERSVKPTQARRNALDEAAARLAKFIGAHSHSVGTTDEHG